MGSNLSFRSWLFFSFWILMLTSCQSKEENSPRIVGWGDSMMAGTLVEESLLELISKNLDRVPYINYAIGGSTSAHAAMLQGATPFYITLNNNEIPAKDKAKVYAYNLEPYNYQSVLQHRFGTIENIEGVLRRYYNREFPFKTTHFEFERKRNGKRVKLDDSVQFHFKDAEMKDEDLVLIWTARNDELTEAGRTDALRNIQLMVERIKKEESRRDYFVISVCNGIADHEGIGTETHAKITEFNALLQNSFGDHFIDLRTYMVNDALSDLNRTINSVDSLDITKDAIPRSLLLDHVHFNQLGTQAAANYVTKTIKERSSFPAIWQQYQAEQAKKH